MPVYEYVCDNGHETEQQGGYEDNDIECPNCRKSAKRRACYRSQGVIFKGVGFTKTVIPPPPPKPSTIPGEPSDDWLEKTNNFAGQQYRDDEEYREERKKQASDMVKQVERGAIA